jgi:hypothetical protein
MTPFNEYYKNLNQYPGSYKVLEHRKIKVKDTRGKLRAVEYMHTTNPFNCTDIAGLWIKFDKKYTFLKCIRSDDPAKLTREFCAGAKVSPKEVKMIHDITFNTEDPRTL